jgi:hypothetical protein
LDFLPKYIPGLSPGIYSGGPFNDYQSRIYGVRLPRSPAKAGSLAMTMLKHLMRLY